MKKITALLLTGAMAFSLAACGGTESGNTQQSGTADNETNTGTTADTDEGAGTENEADVTTAESQIYTVTYNMNDGNTADLSGNQFLGADFSGLINYDSRLNIALTLELDGAGNYVLTSDCYVIEAGERQEVGGETGIGQTWIMTGEGTYTDNGDGTIHTSAATKATLEVATDTYSSQMKDAVAFAIAGSSEDGSWTSAETPELLDYIPETIFTVADGAIVSYMDPNASDETVEESEAAEKTESGKPAGEAVLEIPSDDQGTKFVLYADGAYAFIFESYDITDMGTFTYADGVLTITDKNGAVTTSAADGNNVKFSYAYSDSDQLTGDYTVAAADLDAALNEMERNR